MNGVVTAADAPAEVPAAPAEVPYPRVRGAAAFVWTTWAVLTLAALALVWFYGREVPLYDDWLIVPQMSGAEPVTGTWLWELHYSHRIPLPKLCDVVLARLTHCDLRAGMYFNTLAVALLAAVCIRAARSVRGWTSYADAFVPIALLNFGQHRQFLWSWQIAFIIPMVIVGLMLPVILRREGRLPWRAAVPAGIGLLLLPLCGNPGLLYVPPLALWLGFAAYRQLRDRGDPARLRKAGVLFGLVAATAVLTAVYFIRYEDPTVGARDLSNKRQVLRSFAKVTLQFLSTGLGHVPESYFPATGYVVAALLAVSGIALLVLWWKQPHERLRTLGLLMFLGGAGVTALGVGWGRSAPDWGPGAGLDPHYVCLAVPALLAAYFGWCVFPWAGVGQFMQAALFALVCAFLPLNVRTCLESEATFREAAAAFKQDVRAGVPADVLAERYAYPFFYEDEHQFRSEKLAAAIQNLHDAGTPGFRDLRPAPAYRVVRVPVKPVAVKDVLAWDKLQAEGVAWGEEPSLSFALPEPRFVHAVRFWVRYQAEGVGTEIRPALAWKAADAGEEQYSTVLLGDLVKEHGRQRDVRDGTASFWVNGTVGQFRFLPADKALRFKVLQIELLVPAGEAEKERRAPARRKVSPGSRAAHQGGNG